MSDTIKLDWDMVIVPSKLKMMRRYKILINDKVVDSEIETDDDDELIICRLFERNELSIFDVDEDLTGIFIDFVGQGCYA